MKKRFVSLLGLASVCLSLSATTDEGAIDLSSNYSVAQNKTVRGRIVDKNGDAIIGASIVVKGTTRGTITNIDGEFTIDVNKNEKLVVSYIGYVGIFSKCP